MTFVTMVLAVSTNGIANLWKSSTVTSLSVVSTSFKVSTKKKIVNEFKKK